MSKPIPEDVVYRMIQADADLKALVGNRVFPDVAPAETEDPWIVYQRINNDRTNAHDGYNDLEDPTFQLTAWTLDAKMRKTLREHLLRVFGCGETTLDLYRVVYMHVDDRTFSEDGPPRMYAAQVDISVSL